MADGDVGTLLARDLVGRDVELGVLERAWRDAGTTCVVIAPAGMGKSRLGRELASTVRRAGGLVLTGRCSPTGRHVPLRPWREALLTATRSGRVPGPALDAFVPALGRVVPDWGPPADEGSPLVLGEAIVRLLSSWATAEAATMLLVEDVQWADPESLAVLEYVVDNLDGARACAVVSLRAGETGPGADLAADLIARRVAAPLHLAPLGPDDIVVLARSCLDGRHLPADAVAPLVARSEGVPFLVEELVAAAVRTGWATLDQAVPDSVAASVASRLADLPPAARPLLIAAALLGRDFDWTVAGTAAEIAPDAAADVLRSAVQAQLLDVEGAGFRFRHALTRDAVLAIALPAEVATLASRALDAVIDGGELPSDRSSLAAQLAERANRAGVAAGLWLQAAERALADGALASADALATRAATTDGDHRPDADWVLLRVSAHAGQTERAAALARALLATGSDPARRADVHLTAGSAELSAGRWDEAESHAVSARALVPSDAARLARADALAAQAAMGRSEPDLAAVLARAALDGARATDQPAVACEALEVIGRASRGRDLDAAETAFTQAHDTADRAGLRVWRARAMQELGTIDLFSWGGTQRLEAARRLAVDAGALGMAALVDLQIGALHEERGEVGPALAAARRCEEAARRWRLSTLPMSLVVQSFVHALLGDRPAAEAAAAAAVATGEDQVHVRARLDGHVRALLDVVAGDLPAAAAHLDAAMATLRAHPGTTQVFPGLWALVRTVIDDGGDAARREVAALPVDTPPSRVTLLAAEAVAAGRRGRRDEADARLTAMDRALPRPGGDHRRALVRHLVAPAAHADGWGDPAGWLRQSLAQFDGSGHAALAGRCRRLLAELGQPVPRQGRGDTAVVPPVLAALGITNREVDVLILAAQGASNREIGAQLFISPRTVEKHVERLLMKSGRPRGGLTELATSAGLLRT